MLASEGDEEWCERLAVLTTSALFLLDRSGEDDPLAPFGQPLGRIRLAEDLAEVVLVNTREHNPDGSSTPSFTQLELRTSTLFGRDLLLRGQGDLTAPQPLQKRRATGGPSPRCAAS